MLFRSPVESLKLVITDGTEGLSKSLEHLLPGMPQQSCIIHKMRNVYHNTKVKNRKAVAACTWFRKAA